MKSIFYTKKKNKETAVEKTDDNECDVCSIDTCVDYEENEDTTSAVRCTFPCATKEHCCRRTVFNGGTTCFQHTMCLVKNHYLRFSELVQLEKIIKERGLMNELYAKIFRKAKRQAEEYIKEEQRLIKETIESEEKTNSPGWVKELLDVIPPSFTKLLKETPNYFVGMNVPSDIITLCLSLRDLAWYSHIPLFETQYTTELAKKLNALDEVEWRDVRHANLWFDPDTGKLYPKPWARETSRLHIEELEQYGDLDDYFDSKGTSIPFLTLLTQSAKLVLAVYVDLVDNSPQQVWLRPFMLKAIGGPRTIPREIYPRLKSLINEMNESDLKVVQIAAGHMSMWDGKLRDYYDDGRPIEYSEVALRKNIQYWLKEKNQYLKLEENIAGRKYWEKKRIPFDPPAVDVKYMEFFKVCKATNMDRNDIKDRYIRETIDKYFQKMDVGELVNWLTSNRCNYFGEVIPKFRHEPNWDLVQYEVPSYGTANSVVPISVLKYLATYHQLCFTELCRDYAFKDGYALLREAMRPLMISTLFKQRTKEEVEKIKTKLYHADDYLQSLRDRRIAVTDLVQIINAFKFTKRELKSVITDGHDTSWTESDEMITDYIPTIETIVLSMLEKL